MEKLLKKKPSPFSNLKKSELETELRERGHDVLNKGKSQLQEELTSTLRGIQRPPALLTTTDEISDLKFLIWSSNMRYHPVSPFMTSQTLYRI